MADVDAVISLLYVGEEKCLHIDQDSTNKYLGLIIRDIDSNTFKLVVLNFPD